MISLQRQKYRCWYSIITIIVITTFLSQNIAWSFGTRGDVNVDRSTQTHTLSPSFQLSNPEFAEQYFIKLAESWARKTNLTIPELFRFLGTHLSDLDRNDINVIRYPGDNQLELISPHYTLTFQDSKNIPAGEYHSKIQGTNIHLYLRRHSKLLPERADSLKWKHLKPDAKPQAEMQRFADGYNAYVAIPTEKFISDSIRHELEKKNGNKELKYLSFSSFEELRSFCRETDIDDEEIIVYKLTITTPNIPINDFIVSAIKLKDLKEKVIGEKGSISELSSWKKTILYRSSKFDMQNCDMIFPSIYIDKGCLPHDEGFGRDLILLLLRHQIRCGLGGFKYYTQVENPKTAHLIYKYLKGRIVFEFKGTESSIEKLKRWAYEYFRSGFEIPGLIDRIEEYERDPSANARKLLRFLIDITRQGYNINWEEMQITLVGTIPETEEEINIGLSQPDSLGDEPAERYNKIAYILDAPDKAETLYINLTSRCTNNCTFCLKNLPGAFPLDLAFHTRQDEPTAEEIKKAILARGDPLQFQEITFCGLGEPLTKLAEIKLVSQWLKENYPKIKIRINTNGQANLLHRRSNIASELKGLVDSVSISLNAETVQKYKELCQPGFKEHAFPAILQFARLCKESGIDVTLTVVTDIPPKLGPPIDVKKCREIADILGVKFKERKFIPSEASEEQKAPTAAIPSWCLYFKEKGYSDKDIILRVIPEYEETVFRGIPVLITAAIFYLTGITIWQTGILLGLLNIVSGLIHTYLHPKGERAPPLKISLINSFFSTLIFICFFHTELSIAYLLFSGIITFIGLVLAHASVNSNNFDSLYSYNFKKYKFIRAVDKAVKIPPKDFITERIRVKLKDLNGGRDPKYYSYNVKTGLKYGRKMINFFRSQNLRPEEIIVVKLTTNNKLGKTILILAMRYKDFEQQILDNELTAGGIIVRPEWNKTILFFCRDFSAKRRTISGEGIYLSNESGMRGKGMGKELLVRFDRKLSECGLKGARIVLYVENKNVLRYAYEYLKAGVNITNGGQLNLLLQKLTLFAKEYNLDDLLRKVTEFERSEEDSEISGRKFLKFLIDYRIHEKHKQLTGKTIRIPVEGIIPSESVDLSLVFDPSLPQDELLEILKEQNWETAGITGDTLLYKASGLYIKIAIPPDIVMSEKEAAIIRSNILLNSIRELFAKYKHIRWLRNLKEFIKKIIHLFKQQTVYAFDPIKGYRLILARVPHLIVPTRIITGTKLNTKLNLKNLKSGEASVVLQKEQKLLLVDYIGEMIKKYNWDEITSILKKSFTFLQELWKYGIADIDAGINIWNNLVITEEGELKTIDAGGIIDDFNTALQFSKASMKNASYMLRLISRMGIAEALKEAENAMGCKHLIECLKNLIDHLGEENAERVAKIFFRVLLAKFQPEQVEALWNTKNRQRSEPEEEVERPDPGTDTKGSPAECIKTLFAERRFSDNPIKVEELRRKRGLNPQTGKSFARSTIKQELDNLVTLGLVISLKGGKYHLTDKLRRAPPIAIDAICNVKLNTPSLHRSPKLQGTPPLLHANEITKLDRDEINELKQKIRNIIYDPKNRVTGITEASQKEINPDVLAEYSIRAFSILDNNAGLRASLPVPVNTELTRIDSYRFYSHIFSNSRKINTPLSLHSLNDLADIAEAEGEDNVIFTGSKLGSGGSLYVKGQPRPLLTIGNHPNCPIAFQLKSGHLYRIWIFNKNKPDEIKDFVQLGIIRNLNGNVRKSFYKKIIKPDFDSLEDCSIEDYRLGYKGQLRIGGREANFGMDYSKCRTKIEVRNGQITKVIIYGEDGKTLKEVNFILIYKDDQLIDSYYSNITQKKLNALDNVTIKEFYLNSSGGLWLGKGKDPTPYFHNYPDHKVEIDIIEGHIDKVRILDKRGRVIKEYVFKLVYDATTKLIMSYYNIRRDDFKQIAGTVKRLKTGVKGKLESGVPMGTFTEYKKTDAEADVYKGVVDKVRLIEDSDPEDTTPDNHIFYDHKRRCKYKTNGKTIEEFIYSFIYDSNGNLIDSFKESYSETKRKHLKRATIKRFYLDSRGGLQFGGKHWGSATKYIDHEVEFDIENGIVTEMRIFDKTGNKIVKTVYPVLIYKTLPNGAERLVDSYFGAYSEDDFSKLNNHVIRGLKLTKTGVLDIGGRIGPGKNRPRAIFESYSNQEVIIHVKNGHIDHVTNLYGNYIGKEGDYIRDKDIGLVYQLIKDLDSHLQSVPQEIDTSGIFEILNRLQKLLHTAILTSNEPVITLILNSLKDTLDPIRGINRETYEYIAVIIHRADIKIKIRNLLLQRQEQRTNTSFREGYEIAAEIETHNLHKLIPPSEANDVVDTLTKLSQGDLSEQTILELQDHIRTISGLDLLDLIRKSSIGPGKEHMEHVPLSLASMISGNFDFFTERMGDSVATQRLLEQIKKFMDEIVKEKEIMAAFVFALLLHDYGLLLLRSGVSSHAIDGEKFTNTLLDKINLPDNTKEIIKTLVGEHTAFPMMFQGFTTPLGYERSLNRLTNAGVPPNIAIKMYPLLVFLDSFSAKREILEQKDWFNSGYFSLIPHFSDRDNFDNFKTSYTLRRFLLFSKNYSSLFVPPDSLNELIGVSANKTYNEAKEDLIFEEYTNKITINPSEKLRKTGFLSKLAEGESSTVNPNIVKFFYVLTKIYEYTGLDPNELETFLIVDDSSAEIVNEALNNLTIEQIKNAFSEQGKTIEDILSSINFNFQIKKNTDALIVDLRSKTTYIATPTIPRKPLSFSEYRIDPQILAKSERIGRPIAINTVTALQHLRDKHKPCRIVANWIINLAKRGPGLNQFKKYKIQVLGGRFSRIVGWHKNTIYIGREIIDIYNEISNDPSCHNFGLYEFYKILVHCIEHRDPELRDPRLIYNDYFNQELVAVTTVIYALRDTLNTTVIFGKNSKDVRKTLETGWATIASRYPVFKQSICSDEFNALVFREEEVTVPDIARMIVTTDRRFMSLKERISHLLEQNKQYLSRTESFFLPSGSPLVVLLTIDRNRLQHERKEMLKRLKSSGSTEKTINISPKLSIYLGDTIQDESLKVCQETPRDYNSTITHVKNDLNGEEVYITTSVYDSTDIQSPLMRNVTRITLCIGNLENYNTYTIEIVDGEKEVFLSENGKRIAVLEQKEDGTYILNLEKIPNNAFLKTFYSIEHPKPDDGDGGYGETLQAILTIVDWFVKVTEDTPVPPDTESTTDSIDKLEYIGKPIEIDRTSIQSHLSASEPPCRIVAEWLVELDDRSYCFDRFKGLSIQVVSSKSVYNAWREGNTVFIDQELIKMFNKVSQTHELRNFGLYELYKILAYARRHPGKTTDNIEDDFIAELKAAISAVDALTDNDHTNYIFDRDVKTVKQVVKDGWAIIYRDIPEFREKTSASNFNDLIQRDEEASVFDIAETIINKDPRFSQEDELVKAVQEICTKKNTDFATCIPEPGEALKHRIGRIATYHKAASHSAASEKTTLRSKLRSLKTEIRVSDNFSVKVVDTNTKNTLYSSYDSIFCKHVLIKNADNGREVFINFFLWPSHDHTDPQLQAAAELGFKTSFRFDTLRFEIHIDDHIHEHMYILEKHISDNVQIWLYKDGERLIQLKKTDGRYVLDLSEITGNTFLDRFYGRRGAVSSDPDILPIEKPGREIILEGPPQAKEDRLYIYDAYGRRVKDLGIESLGVKAELPTIGGEQQQESHTPKEHENVLTDAMFEKAVISLCPTLDDIADRVKELAELSSFSISHVSYRLRVLAKKGTVSRKDPRGRASTISPELFMRVLHELEPGPGTITEKVAEMYGIQISYSEATERYEILKRRTGGYVTRRKSTLTTIHRVHPLDFWVSVLITPLLFLTANFLMNFPGIEFTFINFIVFIVSISILPFASLSVHEAAHAVSAKLLGLKNISVGWFKTQHTSDRNKDFYISLSGPLFIVLVLVIPPILFILYFQLPPIALIVLTVTLLNNILISFFSMLPLANRDGEKIWGYILKSRSHRFQKKFRKVLAAKMKDAGYEKKDIERITEKGLVRVDKKGSLEWEKWKLIELAAGVLNEILARPSSRKITPEEVIAVLTVHEKIHTLITRKTAIRIRACLKKSLGEVKYQRLLKYFQNQYGSYESKRAGRLTPNGELEIVEELIANMYMEQMLDNPLRLLNNKNAPVELWPEVVDIIESELGEIKDGLDSLTSQEKHNERKRIIKLLKDRDWRVRDIKSELDVSRHRSFVLPFKLLDLEYVLRMKLIYLLNKNKWNRNKVSELLNMKPDTLGRMLFGLNIAEYEGLTGKKALNILKRHKWNLPEARNEMCMRETVDVLTVFNNLGILGIFKKELAKVLDKENWNLAAAGSYFGIPATTVGKYAEKLGLERKDLTKKQALAILEAEDCNWNITKVKDKLRIVHDRYWERIVELGLKDELKKILKERLNQNQWIYHQTALLFGVEARAIIRWIRFLGLQHPGLTKQEALDILDENDWNLKKSAVKLGVKRRYYLRRLKKLGIEKEFKDKLRSLLKENNNNYIAASRILGVNSGTITIWVEEFNINLLDDLSKNEILDILEDNDWDLQALKKTLGVKRILFWTFFKDKDLLDKLKSKLKERLRIRNWNIEAVKRDFGLVNRHTLENWIRKFKLTKRKHISKNKALRILTKNKWNIPKSKTQIGVHARTNIIKFFTELGIITEFKDILIKLLQQEVWNLAAVGKILGVQGRTISIWLDKLGITESSAKKGDRQVFDRLLADHEIDNLLDLFGLEGTYRLLLRKHGFSPVNLRQFLTRRTRKKNGRNGKKPQFDPNRLRDTASTRGGSKEEESVLAEEIINSIYPKLVDDYRFLDKILAESRNQKNTPFLRHVYKRVYKYYHSVRGFKIKGIRTKVKGKGFSLKFYQRIGIKFILDKKRVILADEPGLGKTIQALGAAMNANNGKGARKVLIICPKSAVEHWRTEIRTKTTEPTDAIIVGGGRGTRERQEKATKIKESRFVIVNYEAIRGENNPLRKLLKKQGFDFVIADEAHRMRNETLLTDAVRGFNNAKYKVLLTGTPLIGKKVNRLCNLFNWLWPEREEFKDKRKFARRYGNSTAGLRHIKTMLNGMILRRLKQVVLYDLPPKEIENVYVELGTEQRKVYKQEERRMRKIYQRIAKAAGAKVSEYSHSSFVSARIRQAAIDSSLVQKQILFQRSDGKEYKYPCKKEKVRLGNKTYTMAYDQRYIITLTDRDGNETKIYLRKLRKHKKVTIGGKEYKVSITKPPVVSTKYDRLNSLVDEVMECGEKLVIFTNYRHVVEDLRNRYWMHGVSYLTGDITSSKVRQEEIDSFQNNPQQRIFISTIPTGGEAITLTAANNVAFIDQPLTPQERSQAIDRVHRIGQRKRVKVYNFIARGTVDEGIEEILTGSELISRLAFDDDPSIEKLDEELMERVMNRLKYSKQLIARLRERFTDTRKDEPVEIMNELYSKDRTQAVRFNGEGFVAWLNLKDGEGVILRGFGELIQHYHKLGNEARQLVKGFFRERSAQELSNGLKIKESILWNLCTELVSEFSTVDYHGDYEVWAEMARYIIHRLIDNKKLTVDELVDDIEDVPLVNQTLYFMDRSNLFKVLSLLGVLPRQYYYTGALLHYDPPLAVVPYNGRIYYSDPAIVREIVPDWHTRPEPPEEWNPEDKFKYRAKNTPKLKSGEFMRLVNESERGNTDARKVLAESFLGEVIEQADRAIRGLWRRQRYIAQQLNKGDVYSKGYEILWETIGRYFDEEEGRGKELDKHIKTEVRKGINRLIALLSEEKRMERVDLDDSAYGEDGTVTRKDLLREKPDDELTAAEQAKKVLRDSGFSELEIEILMAYRLTPNTEEVLERYRITASRLEELLERAKAALLSAVEEDTHPDERLRDILAKEGISTRDVEIFFRLRDGERDKDLAKEYILPTRMIREISERIRTLIGKIAQESTTDQETSSPDPQPNRIHPHDNITSLILTFLITFYIIYTANIIFFSFFATIVIYTILILLVGYSTISVHELGHFFWAKIFRAKDIVWSFMHVSYDPESVTRRQETIISLFGPLTNLILAAVSLLSIIYLNLYIPSIALLILLIAFFNNLFVGFFSLLSFPGRDGEKIFKGTYKKPRKKLSLIALFIFILTAIISILYSPYITALPGSAETKSPSAEYVYFNKKLANVTEALRIYVYLYYQDLLEQIEDLGPDNGIIDSSYEGFLRSLIYPLGEELSDEPEFNGVDLSQISPEDFFNRLSQYYERHDLYLGRVATEEQVGPHKIWLVNIILAKIDTEKSGNKTLNILGRDITTEVIFLSHSLIENFYKYHTGEFSLLSGGWTDLNVHGKIFVEDFFYREDAEILWTQMQEPQGNYPEDPLHRAFDSLFMKEFGEALQKGKEEFINYYTKVMGDMTLWHEFGHRYLSPQLRLDEAVPQLAAIAYSPYPYNALGKAIITSSMPATSRHGEAGRYIIDGFTEYLRTYSAYFPNLDLPEYPTNEDFLYNLANLTPAQIKLIAKFLLSERLSSMYIDSPETSPDASPNRIHPRDYLIGSVLTLILCGYLIYAANLIFIGFFPTIVVSILFLMILSHISVTVHEAGHYILARFFGADSVYYTWMKVFYDPESVTRKQDVLIALSGPSVNIFVSIASAIGLVYLSLNPIVFFILSLFFFNNLFIGILSLLPHKGRDGEIIFKGGRKNKTPIKLKTFWDEVKTAEESVVTEFLGTQGRIYTLNEAVDIIKDAETRSGSYCVAEITNPSELLSFLKTVPNLDTNVNEADIDSEEDLRIIEKHLGSDWNIEDLVAELNIYRIKGTNKWIILKGSATDIPIPDDISQLSERGLLGNVFHFHGLYKRREMAFIPSDGDIVSSFDNYARKKMVGTEGVFCFDTRNLRDQKDNIWIPKHRDKVFSETWNPIANRIAKSGAINYAALEAIGIKAELVGWKDVDESLIAENLSIKELLESPSEILQIIGIKYLFSLLGSESIQFISDFTLLREKDSSFKIALFNHITADTINDNTIELLKAFLGDSDLLLKLNSLRILVGLNILGENIARLIIRYLIVSRGVNAIRDVLPQIGPSRLKNIILEFIHGHSTFREQVNSLASHARREISSSPFSEELAAKDVTEALTGSTEDGTQSKLTQSMAWHTLSEIAKDEGFKGKIICSWNALLQSGLNDGNGMKRLKELVERTKGKVFFYAGERLILDPDYKFLEDSLVYKEGDTLFYYNDRTALSLEDEKDMIVLMLRTEHSEDFSEEEIKPAKLIHNKFFVPLSETNNIENDLLLGFEILRTNANIKNMPSLFQVLLVNAIRQWLLKTKGKVPTEREIQEILDIEMPDPNVDYLEQIEESYRHLEKIIASA